MWIRSKESGIHRHVFIIIACVEHQVRMHLGQVGHSCPAVEDEDGVGGTTGGAGAGTAAAPPEAPGCSAQGCNAEHVTPRNEW